MRPYLALNEVNMSSFDRILASFDRIWPHLTGSGPDLTDIDRI